MAIELPDLTTLDETAVTEAHSYIAQKIGEYAPTIETKRGVLHDVLFHLEAVLQTAQDSYADKLRKSGSLLAISENPADATDAIVDQIASNFRATRFAGDYAAGSAVIVISQFLPSSVTTANFFSANGQTFAPTETFFGRINSAQVVNASDRLIKPVGDGTYYYTVNFKASAVGAAGNLKRNSKLVPSTPIPYFVTAYAEGSFSNGSDYESNADFVKRLQEGISSKNVSNRLTINAAIRDQAAFASVLAVSSVGYGDPEQIRYHSIFPTASGNRLDVYVRAQSVPKVTKLNKTATLIGRENGGGLWQVSILKTDAPGFYNVDKIIKADVVDSDSQTGFEIVNDIRSFDLSNEATSFIPDIINASEAAYSPFQTSIIRFIDTSTSESLEVGATASYSLFCRGMSLIRDIHDFLSGRDVRPAAGDVLVKAPVPCDLKLSFVIYKKITDAAVDTASIQTALADTVNKLEFTGRLAASTLHSVIHGYLTAGQTVSSIEMFGAIRKPDGNTIYVRDFDILEIPMLPSEMVSPKTTVFILDPADVGVSVQNIDSTAI
jgi:hypothetical protein